MGDPRKARKQYAKPPHPWNKTRIGEEKALIKEYGLKNKKEIWKMTAVVSKFSKQSKKLSTDNSTQGELEKQQMMARVQKLGLLPAGSVTADVLDLKVADVMERRLQTILCKKRLARSVKQARQFIVHGHVIINGTKMTVPSYLVPIAEESQIDFVDNSSLANEDHPERKIEEKEEIKTELTEKPKDDAKPKKEVKSDKKAKPKTEKKESKKDDKPQDKKKGEGK